MRDDFPSRLMAAPHGKTSARARTKSFGNVHEFSGRQKVSSPSEVNAASKAVESVAWVITPLALCSLGRALEAKGETQKAETAYRAALRLAPGLTEAQARLDALRSKRE